tara:strand:- start:245 stop:592 length:348 start_codon:yes stop_codon:yes gene_type:complete
MSRRLSAKVGEYQDKQTQEVKGEYVQIGVILSNDKGEFLLLDPTVSLAGVLAKQNALEFKKGGTMRDNVMCGIYDDQPKQNNQNNNNQGGFNNQNQNHNQNQNQGGFNNQGGNRG